MKRGWTKRQRAVAGNIISCLPHRGPWSNGLGIFFKSICRGRAACIITVHSTIYET